MICVCRREDPLMIRRVSCQSIYACTVVVQYILHESRQSLFARMTSNSWLREGRERGASMSM